MRCHQLTLFSLSLLTLTLSSGKAVIRDVVEKNPGESVTILCSLKIKPTSIKSLSLKKVIDKEDQLLYWDMANSTTITRSVRPRLMAEKAGPMSMRITLSNLTVDDTGIYLCQFTELRGNKLFKTQGEGSINLAVKPVIRDLVEKNPGESVTILCSLKIKPTSIKSLSLKKVLDIEDQLLHWDMANSITITRSVRPRLVAKKAGPMSMLITLSNLTVDDTGIYLCQFTELRGNKLFKTQGEGSINLAVKPGADVADAKGENAETNHFTFILLCVLSTVIVLLLSALVIIWIIPKMRSRSMQVHAVGQHPRAKGSDVYEVMRSTFRH